MKISSLEKKLKTIGSKLEDKTFMITGKKIKILTLGEGSDTIEAFVYDQSNDSETAIYFDTFSQVQQHFNY